MKKMSLLTIMLIISNIFFAQTSEKFWEKGDSLLNLKKYKQAGIMYANSLFDKNATPNDYYHIATTFAKAKDTHRAIYFIDLSAINGFYKKNELNSNSAFFFLKELKEWDKILDKIQENFNNYEKGYNISLIKELESIRMKDQLLRSLIKDDKKYLRNSIEHKYLWSLIQYQDSLNLKNIINIIDKYGWPGTNLVGNESNKTVWLVIQHSPLKTQEYYLPYLKKSVAKGESRGRDLAYLEDRILMTNGKPQKYGSQLSIDSKTGARVFYKIEDVENVNKRRAEVGLGTIEEYAEKYNIKWENTKDVKVNQ